LAVDDDPLVMRIWSEVFAERAYTLIARTGRQGLIFSRSSGPMC